MTNAVYFVSVTLCTYNFYKGISTDPGFVPKAVSDTEIKMVSITVYIGTGQLIGCR